MITLTPPTVGRQSADDRPIYRPIKCQILALFSSADNKIDYIYLQVVIFFFHQPTVLRFWQSADDRPKVGRRSADRRPISWPMSYLNELHIIGRCVCRPSADHRPTIGRLSLTTYHRPICRPIVGRRSADCKVLKLIKVIGE